MNKTLIIRFLGIGLVCNMISSCMEEPLKADLNDVELDLDSRMLYDISGVTYQIPPLIGSKTKLHLGTSEDFFYKAILLKSSYISNESYLWTLTSFLDTNIIIDSAYFTINVQKDTLETPATFELFYFTQNSLDSIFSESESNYLNFTNSEISTAEFLTEGIEESYVVDSTTSKYRIRFDVEDIFDSTFADTSLNYSFMMNLPDGNDEFHTFFSREYDYTDELDPKIDVYFRQFTYPDSADTSQDVHIDTISRSFLTSQDISILVPPDLDDLDTSHVSIGRGKGLRGLVKLDFLDSLQLPKQTSFDKAELTFHMVPDTNISSFNIWAVPLSDTFLLDQFESFNEDNYIVHSTLLSSGSVLNNKVVFNIKDFIQNQYFENVDNLGLKLYANINNNLQSDVHFYSVDHDSLYPTLFIQYVAP